MTDVDGNQGLVPEERVALTTREWGTRGKSDGYKNGPLKKH